MLRKNATEIERTAPYFASKLRDGISCVGLGELAPSLEAGILWSMETATINYKIGNEKLIRVLDAASAKLRALLTRQGRAHGALRVSVIGGGCSGLQVQDGFGGWSGES